MRSAIRIGRFLVTALDALGRARMARDNGIAQREWRLHAACAEIATIHDLQLGVRGAFPSGPAVIVTNHVSYLDAICVAAVLPCAPIAKSEVAGWPIIGPAAAQLGVNFVERENPHGRVRALFRAKAALDAGIPVLNFPEGTTTDGRTLLPFSRGIFGLARLCRVPVFPVAIKCARELAWFGGASFVPHYLKTTKLDAPQIQLEVGPWIDPTQLASASEVAALAHHRIAHMLRGQLEPHDRARSVSSSYLPSPRVAGRALVGSR